MGVGCCKNFSKSGSVCKLYKIAVHWVCLIHFANCCTTSWRLVTVSPDIAEEILLLWCITLQFCNFDKYVYWSECAVGAAD